MRLSRATYDAMVAHARAELPNECCGLLGGVDGEPATFYPTRNSFESPMRFEIHASDQFRVIEREMPDKGEELIALYHSHPNSPAEPSQTDINLAEWWPGTAWIICSLADRDEPVIRAFSIDGSAVEEIELAVG